MTAQSSHKERCKDISMTSTYMEPWEKRDEIALVLIFGIADS